MTTNEEGGSTGDDVKTPLIKLDTIEKWYGTVHALRGVRFAVEHGGFMALVGPHGAGQSEPMKLVGALGRPDHGYLGAEARVDRATMLDRVAAIAAGISVPLTADLHFAVPEDYGYVHNVFLTDAHGARLARQGFVVAPHMTVSPSSGPLGTPIHIHVTGLGYKFYHLVWHLKYDGADAGMLSGLSTRGVADVTLPATGRRAAVPWHRGDGVARLIVLRVEPVEVLPVAALPAAARGTDGFGSTGA